MTLRSCQINNFVSGKEVAFHKFGFRERTLIGSQIRNDLIKEAKYVNDKLKVAKDDLEMTHKSMDDNDKFFLLIENKDLVF